MGAKLEFLKTAAKDHRVGAITPTSKFVIRRLLRLMNPRAEFVIEYGAGDGVITEELLRILPERGKVLAIEINEAFVGQLREIKDTRLTVVHDDVREAIARPALLGVLEVDAVLSGIPFSFLSHHTRKEIVQSTHAILEDGGQFLLYQTSPLMVPYLRAVFGESVHTRFEPRNLPPYFIIEAIKQS